MSKDHHTKDYTKSKRSLWKIIKNHPDISSSRFSLLELEKQCFLTKCHQLYKITNWPGQVAVSFFWVKFNIANSMIFWKKNLQFFFKNQTIFLNFYKWFKKVVKNIHEWNFFFSYFLNSQIWLNWLMAGCHLGYTAKLKKKLTALWHYNWDSFLKIYNNCLPNIKKLLSIIWTGKLGMLRWRL